MSFSGSVLSFLVFLAPQSCLLIPAGDHGAAGEALPSVPAIGRHQAKASTGKTAEQVPDQNSLPNTEDMSFKLSYYMDTYIIYT